MIVILPDIHSQRLCDGWFPASGYRHHGTGVLNSVSSGGWLWSSSPDASGSTNGSNLNFNSTTINPRNNNNRAYGFVVRCVSQYLEAIFSCLGYKVSRKKNAIPDVNHGCVFVCFVCV
ncbi:hypothetical protein [Bacteroides sp.]